MAKKYIVTLADDERAKLLKLLGSGTAKARTISRARIPLKANAGGQDKEIYPYVANAIDEYVVQAIK